jgi:hypothetical protein
MPAMDAQRRLAALSMIELAERMADENRPQARAEELDAILTDDVDAGMVAVEVAYILTSMIPRRPLDELIRQERADVIGKA